MDGSEIFDQLARLPTRTYSYVVLAALFGPMILRLLGLKPLAALIRPLALALLLGGMYARQQGSAPTAGAMTSSR